LCTQNSKHTSIKMKKKINISLVLILACTAVTQAVLTADQEASKVRQLSGAQIRYDQAVAQEDVDRDIRNAATSTKTGVDNMVAMAQVGLEKAQQQLDEAIAKHDGILAYDERIHTRWAAAEARGTDCCTEEQIARRDRQFRNAIKMEESTRQHESWSRGLRGNAENQFAETNAMKSVADVQAERTQAQLVASKNGVTSAASSIATIEQRWADTEAAQAEVV